MIDATIPTVTRDSQIGLRPLSRQIEDDGAVIVGYGQEFLELPLEGLDFLQWLDEGLTLAQARDRFEARYAPFPDEDLDAFVAAFLECDFIAAVDGQPIPIRQPYQSAETDWFPQRWARAIFSTPVLLFWILFVAPAAALWITTPELWPRQADYFWSDYNFIIILVGILLWLFNMAIHEFSHWAACRAKGIEATITWTQRVGFFPMSQTIMHNIWAVPRSTRLLPIAAGMVWDIFGLSVALYLLYFDLYSIITLPVLVTGLLKFYVLTTTMALAAQFWLFSKMDGYFLLSALLGQRNLQGDTYTWLKTRLSKLRHFEPPRKGMRFIYVYVVITIFWGGLFVGQFLLVDLPIKLQLLGEALVQVAHSHTFQTLAFADGLAVLTSQTIFWGLLFYAYWRDTLPNWRNALQTTNHQLTT